MARTILCCPHCGSSDLHSTEKVTIDYPVRMGLEDGEIKVRYDESRDRRLNDEGSEYEGKLYCLSDGKQLKESELVTWRVYAHREPLVMQIDEDSDRGADTRWQAVCSAAHSDDHGSWSCDWAGPWHRATDFVDQAERETLSGPEGVYFKDPGQLAFEAAEADGRDHLAEYGVASDSSPSPAGEDASHGSPDREGAPQGAPGAADSRT